MIQNERQYKITQSQLKEFEQVLASIDPQDPTQHPRKILSERNHLLQVIDTLKQELVEYEELKNGRVDTFQLQSLSDVPITLIKARIARGMTQKELGEKIGVQEQQIQRYESSHYSSIGFDRLREIFEALGISFKEVVMEINPL